MSNARYFAQGTDFYRVIHANGTMDGPYTSESSARRQGSAKNGNAVRRHYLNWDPNFKVQKLVPVAMKCNETAEDCFPNTGFCFGEHGQTLGWRDI